MRVILQRVQKAAVIINKQEKRKISNGLVVLLGIEEADGEEDIDWLCKKIVNMRIFEDTEEKMNLSLNDCNGDLLLVSQFTLHALTKKGNRPSFIKSAKPEISIPLYESFCKKIKPLVNGHFETGEFGAYMEVKLINDGPVTIFMDSKNKI
ncbi:MAG: D-tyrosyl-tRNA(Tyr) deacylase [Chitinophagaceae bacterium]|nr:MAG: D-tyrosyl-tRNA(Tyr) deacylase [Chitinophagaceae bacterium]